MSISPDTHERIEHFRRIENIYTPNEHVQREIGSRTLTMIVGPSVIGKSSVMKAVSDSNPDFGRSTTLSTRTPRADDDTETFRLVEHDDANINALLDKVLSGQLVQYKFHPTENTFYGSEVTDHPYAHNMLPTLSGAISQLQQVGFRDTSVVALVSPPSEWTRRFNARYPGKHPHYTKRAEEALISLNDLLLRTDVSWVVNYEGDVQETAQKVIKAAEHTIVDDQELAQGYAYGAIRLAKIALDRAHTEKHA